METKTFWQSCLPWKFISIKWSTRERTLLHTKPLLKRGLLWGKRICLQGEKIVPFRVEPFAKGRQKPSWQSFPVDLFIAFSVFFRWWSQYFGKMKYAVGQICLTVVMSLPSTSSELKIIKSQYTWKFLRKVILIFKLLITAVVILIVTSPLYVWISCLVISDHSKRCGAYLSKIPNTFEQIHIFKKWGIDTQCIWQRLSTVLFLNLGVKIKCFKTRKPYDHYLYYDYCI